jgi:hypothetical protein
MFLRTLKAEQIKLRNSPIWLAFIIIPLISAIMGTFNYLNNTEVLTKEWYSLWTQHTLFYCYFCFPALIGVYCSYICRLEHINNNWNSVLTAPVKVSSIYFAKLVTVMKILFLTQAFVGLLFYISGKISGLNTPFPIKELLLWLFLGLCASAAIASLQLAASLMIRSFAVPIGIAMIGGILGLGLGAKGLGLYFPYSLFSLGMSSINPSATIGFNILPFLAFCSLFLIIFSSLSILKIEKSN